MKINVLKKSKDELTIEIEGEGHTFCNLLQESLLEDKNVQIAGYDKPHPLSKASVVYIRVKGDKSVEKTLEAALQRMIEKTTEFVEKFEAETRGT